MKKILGVIILSLFFCTPAWAANSQNWLLFSTLQNCGDDFQCFEKKINYFNDKGWISSIKRIFNGDYFMNSSVQHIRKGRKHKENISYMSYSETFIVRGYYIHYYNTPNVDNSTPECNLTLYYHPQTFKVQYLTRSGACAKGSLPALPNGVLLEK